jgi:hypothetical protein
MNPSIFITYNPSVPTEEATALRLQTIAHLYGLWVELPDRLGAGAELNTRQRIQRAGYVVAFPLHFLSDQVKSELDYAISCGKTIILVYDRKIGKTVTFHQSNNIFETFIDFENQNTDQVLQEIASFIRNKHAAEPNAKQASGGLTTTEKSLLAFVGIGLGIIALAALLERK